MAACCKRRPGLGEALTFDGMKAVGGAARDEKGKAGARQAQLLVGVALILAQGIIIEVVRRGRSAVNARRLAIELDSGRRRAL